MQQIKNFLRFLYNSMISADERPIRVDGKTVWVPLTTPDYLLDDMFGYTHWSSLS